MKIFDGPRMFLLVLLCPLRFKQGVLTVLAAYMRQRGDESGAALLEKTADRFNLVRKKGIGRKCVKVQITCECGKMSLAASAVELKRSNWGCCGLGCCELSHMHPTLPY